jgi:hypothetical protein
MIVHQSLDRHFFSIIDTPEKAYVLGLIWSDGTIDSRSKQVRLRLHEEDGEVLEAISKIVGGAPPKTIAPSGNAKSPQSALIWSSQKMVSDLERLGLCRNKDQVLPKAKMVDLRFEADFVRGLVDGDGCVQFVNSTPRISFRNRNDQLLGFVRDFWKRSTGVDVSLDGKKPHKVTGRIYPSIYMSGTNAVAAANATYDGGRLAMARKLSVVNEFKRWVPSPHRNRFRFGPVIKRIGSSGNSAALLLDAAVADHLGVSKGDFVEVELMPDSSLSVRRLKMP